MLCADCDFFGDEGGPLIPFLTVLIRPVGIYFASVFDAKGPTDLSVRTVVDCIRFSGLVRFIYRSDLEKALLSLIENAVRQSGRHGYKVRVLADGNVE